MILSKPAAGKMLQRMALEIAEHNFEKDEIIIIGIKENGMVIAKKIKELLAACFNGGVKIYALSINKKCSDDIVLEEGLKLKDKIVLLTDDVANSGKTMMYAMQPLLLQHPAQIQTMALVERTHKIFPVALNYVGLSVATGKYEHIIVGVENGEITGAWLENK